jgi:hypothetical protein
MLEQTIRRYQNRALEAAQVNCCRRRRRLHDRRGRPHSVPDGSAGWTSAPIT